ncbi:MAG: hypothetical protein K8F91_13125, partial [Candidatus Obscuribacterales bacterium]|nr:hypothetical protein [Candidatus Obscuribacterales bacterium]
LGSVRIVGRNKTDEAMTKSESTVDTAAESFVDYLKRLPWCKQADSVLVAVHKATPEIIERMKDHEVKVFPGRITVKLQKSVLSNFQKNFDDGQPLPVVLVWKVEGLEIWYRKVKPTEFPYDAWSDSTAAAYEQERVFLPVADFEDGCGAAHSELAAGAKACPSMMPSYE